MKVNEIAEVLERILRDDGRFMFASVAGTQSSVLVGAWGERKTSAILLVDPDGDCYDLTLIPTNPPDKYQD